MCGGSQDLDVLGFTRDDVLAAAARQQHHHTLSTLRSLFRHCKKTCTVFCDPAARIRVGRHGYNLIFPLPPKQIMEALDGAATPAARLALALAAVMPPTGPSGLTLMEGGGTHGHSSTASSSTRPPSAAARRP